MKPYYSEGGITLYHGDAEAVLLTLGAFDAVVTDPPYGETSLEWDRRASEWCRLVNAPQLWCFGSMRFWLGAAADFRAAGWRYAQEIVWEKHNGSSFHADRFRRVHEFAAHWYRGAWGSLYRRVPQTNDATCRTVRRKGRPAHTGEIAGSTYASEDGGPRLMRSVLRVRSCHGTALHPTQKPEGIVAPLIEFSVPPGGSVLDPFAGSGTTLVVARALGCSAVGIELDERFCEAAAKRLSQGVLQFDAAPGGGRE